MQVERDVVTHLRQMGNAASKEACMPAARPRISQSIADALLIALFCSFVFLVAYCYDMAPFTVFNVLVNAPFLQ
jgi:hypothetical protein